jgi:hypothetical protein
MSDDDRKAKAQLSADDPSGTGTTIVGGQPARPRRPLRAIPVGIEKLLFTAAIEPAFREALLRDREAAIRARGIALAPSELAMLKLAPASQLANAIDALDTSASNLARRGFLHAVAGAVTLAAGTALSACDGDPPKPERPAMAGQDGGLRDVADLPRPGPDAGVRIDAPVYHPDAGSTRDVAYLEAPAPAGIRPDDLGKVDK